MAEKKAAAAKPRTASKKVAGATPKKAAAKKPAGRSASGLAPRAGGPAACAAWLAQAASSPGTTYLQGHDEAQADLVISGSVVRYTNSVFGFNAREQAEEYQVAVAVRLTARDRVKNREMWRDDNLVRTTNYFVVAPVGQTPQDQYTSRKDAIEKLADAVLNKTVEGW